MEEDKKEVEEKVTYHQFTILVENISDDVAEKFAEYLAQSLDILGLKGSVESTPKTEEEILSED